MAAERGAAEAPSRGNSPLAFVLHWLLRVANTMLLALGVWALWLIAERLDLLIGELINLVDFVQVIAERLNY